MNVLPVASVNPSLVTICCQVDVYVFKIYLYKMFYLHYLLHKLLNKQVLIGSGLRRNQSDCSIF